MTSLRSNLIKQLGGVAALMLGVALLFVGWVWLLSFPWSWVVPAVAVLEGVLIIFVLAFESGGRRVNGAGGWMTFGYVMGHVWFFAGAAVLRVLVWGWQSLLH